MSCGAVGERDGLVFDVGALLDAAVVAARRLRVGLGGGDAVDGEQPEVAQQGLVVHAAQCGVVDDALRAGDVGCEAGEAVHGGAGFAAGRGDPFDVEDDAAVHVGRCGRRRGRTWCPRRFRRRLRSAVPASGSCASGTDLAGRPVDACVAGLGPEEGSDDLAVGVEHPATGRDASTSRDRRGRGARARGPGRRRARGAASASVGEDVGVGEVAVAGVEVVVATHRRCRAASRDGSWGSGAGSCRGAGPRRAGGRARLRPGGRCRRR